MAKLWVQVFHVDKYEVPQLWPGMAGIASSKFFLHLGVAVSPEIRDVFCHLPRAIVGGEYVNEEGDSSSRYGGRGFGIFQLGELCGEKGILLGVISNLRRVACS